MSDTPKFEVIDRRKFKAEEEQESARTATVVEPTEPSAGPQLVTSESKPAATSDEVHESSELGDEAQPELPPPPTAEESRQQKAAYDASAQRLEELVRAQNPAMGAQPPVGFEHLVQQLYISAMIQLGAGAQEGQRPRVDILGAKTTIDLMEVLAEKTKGNLNEAEDRAMRTVLFEVRMAFNELTNMITLQGMQPPPPPPPGKR
jgi:hypothetical protein